jgi:membrane-bound serine protease (ClpP class)
MEFFWQLLIDPNVVYLLLVAGLLCTVLAFASPGTGLPEAGALIFLAFAFLGLLRLPTNWFGVGLITLSLLAFLGEAKWMSHGAFTISGIIALTLGSLMLFGINYESVRVSIWLIGLTVITTTLFFVYIVGAALSMRNQPAKQNQNAVIGMVGEVKTDILKEGTVLVDNELWTAQADETIAAGTSVQVIERNGLKLKVKKV